MKPSINTFKYVVYYPQITIKFIVNTASVVQWSEFLATDTEVPGSIPSATRFSE